MRNTILTILLALCTITLQAAETLLLDFESATVPSTVGSWNNYAKAGTSASTWAAPNPKVDEVNASLGSYKIVKTSSDPYWIGLEVTLATAVSITAENQYLHVLVHKSTNSRIALTYTPEGGSQSADAWQSNSTTGAWIDYVLTIPVGTKLKTFAIKIADDAGDYFFDQILLSDSGTALSRTLVGIDPTQTNQVMEGWGASLCWWANIMGGFTDAKVKTVCDWIASPTGLNMNVFRFNIGGGDDPTHKHMRTDGGDMPGYKLSADAPYDWSQDANQRRILQQLIASRIEKAGVNDIQIVAFSNSPPYWMTRSGCSAGSVEGNVTNLKDDMFDDFADYLTEVARYYHDSLDITFNYLEPFNEPEATWWKALGGQEGCFFSNADQMRMIRELYASMEQKNMLSYCGITANDANTIDHTYSSLLVFAAAKDIVPKLDLISTHSYGGNNHALLANWAKANNKKLWQSESGPLYVGSGYDNQVMIMADRIITDLRNLKCTAWCDWQIAGTGGLGNAWALIAGNYDDPYQPITRNTNYYVRSQFSRHIKAGYTIIGSTAPNTVAALSPDKTELVLVVSNSKTYTEKFEVDLSAFTNFGKVKQYRTRASEALNIKHDETRFEIVDGKFTYNALGESVATFVIPVSLKTSSSILKHKNGGFFYSNGQLRTQFPESEYVNATVFNLAGQTILQLNQLEGIGSTPINLERGIYLIHMNVQNEVLTKRILVP